MEKKVISAELVLERYAKGEKHTSTYEVRTDFSKDTCVSDIADFVEGMEKLWRLAINAGKHWEKVSHYQFEICEAVYGDGYDSLSFDRWVSKDIYGDICLEKGEESVYFRPDERYTDANRDMSIGKNILRDMAFTMH